MQKHPQAAVKRRERNSETVHNSHAKAGGPSYKLNRRSSKQLTMGCGSSTPANATQPAAGPQKAAPAPAIKPALKTAPPPVIKAEVTVEKQARFRTAVHSILQAMLWACSCS